MKIHKIEVENEIGTVILLQGGAVPSTMLWEFSGISKTLNDAGFTTIFWDSAGYGENLSEGDPVTQGSWKQFKEELLAVLALYTDSPAHVIGYCTSSLAVLSAASNHPELIKSVMLLNPWMHEPSNEIVIETERQVLSDESMLKRGFPESVIAELKRRVGDPITRPSSARQGNLIADWADIHLPTCPSKILKFSSYSHRGIERIYRFIGEISVQDLDFGVHFPYWEPATAIPLEKAMIEFLITQ